ncbi:MAG: DoxX family protein [Acidobacteriota bacterium]
MTEKGWARMFARVMAGILFFMAGWYKCFELTPMAHARGGFVEPYADTWIPVFLLWALGLAIPVVELVAGALLIVGWRTRDALVAIGLILLVVTYGHALKEPLYSIKDHILPRGLLMLLALLLPASKDLLSVDSWMERRRQT